MMLMRDRYKSFFIFNFSSLKLVFGIKIKYFLSKTGYLSLLFRLSPDFAFLKIITLNQKYRFIIMKTLTIDSKS